MKILGLTRGDPTSPRTYSGVPYQLFAELDKRGLMASRLNVDYFSSLDAISGGLDVVRSIATRRLARNPLWRYFPKTQSRQRSRLAKRLLDGPEFDTIIQIGVSGIIKGTATFAAHVEISVEAAMDIPRFAKSYGFSNRTKSERSRAIAGEIEFLQSCDVIWTNSEWTRSTFEKYPIDASRFFVHPPGANLADPGPIHRADNSLKLLFVGKDWQRKGGPLLIESFNRIRQRFPDAELTIIGCQPDVECAGVRVLGFLDQKDPKQAKLTSQAFRDATVFCMPSEWESVGLVYMEAALYSLPVIMLGGQGRESIFPRSMAIHLAAATSEDLTRTLSELASNPDHARRLGASGRNHVINNYTWPIVTDRLLSAIESKRSAQR